jgi:hypothetical protein
MPLRGLPPPRIVISVPSAQAHHPVASICKSSSLLDDHAATDRILTPSGISPVVTSRHIAISSLRARATIMVVLPVPFGPSVRAR